MSFVNFVHDMPSATVRGDILYEGIVVDNKDPLKIGRVRVRVNQFFPAEVIKDSSCPWAAMRRGGWGGTSERSEFSVPEKNSKVLVHFLGGDIYSPLYETCPPDASTKISSLETNYPNRYGWKDPDGSNLVVDFTSHTLDYVHQSGLELHVRENKAVDIIFPYDKTEAVTQDENKNVGRDQVLDVQRDQINTITRDLTENVTRNVLQIIGGTLTITATGNIVITGATIALTPTPGSGNLKLGSSTPTDFIAFKAALDAILTWATTHTHGGVTTGGGNTGTSATSLSFSSGTHYSSTTKAS